jgi:hypothetical protein
VRYWKERETPTPWYIEIASNTTMYGFDEYSEDEINSMDHAYKYVVGTARYKKSRRKMFLRVDLQDEGYLIGR